MELEDLRKLLLKLSNSDVSRELQSEIDILEQKSKNIDDEKILDLLCKEFNQLASRINNEIELEKERR